MRQTGSRSCTPHTRRRALGSRALPPRCHSSRCGSAPRPRCEAGVGKGHAVCGSHRGVRREREREGRGRREGGKCTRDDASAAKRPTWGRLGIGCPELIVSTRGCIAVSTKVSLTIASDTPHPPMTTPDMQSVHGLIPVYMFDATAARTASIPAIIVPDTETRNNSQKEIREICKRWVPKRSQYFQYAVTAQNAVVMAVAKS